jgi:hypothetical protein
VQFKQLLGFRAGILFLIVFFAAGLGFLALERSRYSIVSDADLFKTRQKLNTLSLRERRGLAYFFNQLISVDHFPYTLIGDKPMSIAPIMVEYTDDLLLPFRDAFNSRHNQKLRQGYQVWKKYQSLFPSKKHMLIEYPFLGRGRIEIALICHESCMKVIRNHLSDFQEVLGGVYACEEVFDILTHPEHKNFYKIIDHNRLIGILLGYGRDNSCLYEKYRGGSSRSDIIQSPQIGADSLRFFSDEWPMPGKLFSPNFACDPDSEETRNLRKHYSSARKNVCWTFFLRDKLEVTLALLEHD